MSQTHYYYALNRRAGDALASLTWKQFLEKFGWGPPSQWGNIGGFFAFGLDRPQLPEEPTPQQIAPILRWTIRKTIPRMSPQYFMLLELSYQLKRQSVVKADIDAERQEDESEALLLCAIYGFLDGDIDARTLWGVLTIHEAFVSDLFNRWTTALTESDRRRIKAVKRQFGRCRPIFDWQTLESVRDGHTVLHEEDTRRFAHFIRLAWRKNWPVCSVNKRLRRVRLQARPHTARCKPCADR